MKKVLVLMAFCVVGLFAGNAFALDCSSCHSANPALGGATPKEAIHAVPVQGINGMTNPMHMSMKDCATCHDRAAMATAKESGASLKGGSVAALAATPSCAGCHNGAVAPAADKWDAARVKLHKFSTK